MSSGELELAASFISNISEFDVIAYCDIQPFLLLISYNYFKELNNFDNIFAIKRMIQFQNLSDCY